MSQLRNGLLIGLLFIACIAGLQVSFLLVEVASVLRDAGAGAAAVLNETSNAIAGANDALKLAESTLAIQQSYYRDSASHIKALTKAAAIDAIQLGRLIEHTDARLARVTVALETSAKAIDEGADTFANQSERIGDEARPLLEAATDATQKAGNLAGDPSLKRSLRSLEASSENLQTTTAEASKAMGYIRDMLSPAKKSFWKRLLYLMIPRPTVSVP